MDRRSFRALPARRYSIPPFRFAVAETQRPTTNDSIAKAGESRLLGTLSLLAGASYPAITVTVNVAANAPAQVINQVSVSEGGSTSATAGNFTSTLGPCDLSGAGSASAADVQRIIDEALGVAAAVDDLNGDGVVNILDVQIEINAALGLGCAAK